MRMNNEEENFELLDNIEKRFDITNHMHFPKNIFFTYLYYFLIIFGTMNS